MALEGSFHKYATGQFGLYCTWSGVQDEINNSTEITMNVYVRYYTLDVGARSGSTVSIDGVEETYTASSIKDTSSSSYHRGNV